MEVNPKIALGIKMASGKMETEAETWEKIHKREELLKRYGYIKALNEDEDMFKDVQFKILKSREVQAKINPIDEEVYGDIDDYGVF